jgi:hypothetical protein
MSAEIIDFTTHRRTAGTDDAPRKTVGTLTTTAKNERLRSARHEAWRKANALRNYWDTLLGFTDAVWLAKKYDLKEARVHCPEISKALDIIAAGRQVGMKHDDVRWSFLNRYREALGKQLLTPAPDVASVNWKRQQLSKPYIGVEKELVEKAIADDIAFLDAHPTRNSRANKLRQGEARS